MKDNNIVAFYCSNCHNTVWNYEHNFEQLHEKGLCAKCLKKQNNPKDKWQKLKEWVSFTQPENINDEFLSGACAAYSNVIDKMQELEGEDVED